MLAIAAFMFIGCLLSIIGLFTPALNALLMPRFGWIGLFLCANVLIFLGFWIKKPTQSTLKSSGFMCLAIAAINGATLLHSGTVAVVGNTFHDKLHSAWLWSVGLYGGAGIYLATAAYRQRDTGSDRS